ncbi:MAG: crossover junction endodeoxyribonuclease RuvC [Zetaproteobacteria bacterium]|nr:MAG: crossover junction endodeoxyribonuclease RuvC [Zetaproteobacteria bacterium]
MRILGIDPGSRSTGVGIIDAVGGRLRRVHHQTIRCADRPFPHRLAMLFLELKELIARFRPDVAAVEDLFMAKNASAALKLGQARGALIAACADAGIEVFAYPPATVKQALAGFGRADKGQIQYMVGMLLATREPVQEDAADALAVAICHAHHCPMRRPQTGKGS